MNKLPKWVIPDNFPALYDSESATVIEMTGKLYNAINELIEDYNKFVDSINDGIETFENSSNKNYEEFKLAMSQEFEDFIGVVELKVQSIDSLITEKFYEQNTHIAETIVYIKNNLIASINHELTKMKNNGEMSNEVLKVFNNLQASVQNLDNRMNTFTSLPSGSTSADAELIDIRNAFDGVVYSSAGESVREQARNNFEKSERIKEDLYDLINIEFFHHLENKALIKNSNGGYGVIDVTNYNVYYFNIEAYRGKRIMLNLHSYSPHINAVFSSTNTISTGFISVADNENIIPDNASIIAITTQNLSDDTIKILDSKITLLSEDNENNVNFIRENQKSIEMLNDEIFKIVNLNVHLNNSNKAIYKNSDTSYGAIEKEGFNIVLFDVSAYVGDYLKLDLKSFGNYIKAVFSSTNSIATGFICEANNMSKIPENANYLMITTQNLENDNVGIYSLKTDEFIREIENINKPKAILTFIDDDGYANALENWETIFNECGIAPTVALATFRIDNPDYSFMGTWETVERLQNKGFEFISHTHNHINCRDVDAETLENDIKASIEMLKTHNCNSSALVYPYNAYSETSMNITKKYFKCCFTCEETHNTPPILPQLLKRYDFYNSSSIIQKEYNGKTYDVYAPKTLASLKNIVDNAIANGGWSVIMTHFRNSYADKFYFDDDIKNTMIELCKYATSKGVKIVNVSEGFELFKNRFEYGSILDENYYIVDCNGNINEK